MTESQETLCSMEEESSLTQPVLEMQDQQPPALSEKQPKGDDQVKEDESIPTASEISTQTLSDHEVESDGETAKESTPESEEVEEEEEEDQNDAPASGEYFSSLPSMENEATGGLKKECLYKILVIGELGTGKTSIIKRYVHQFFSQHYRATIGVDFALKVINWDPNTIIRLQLWDIAGQERFGNMTRVYYKEAVGAFIVFDVTRAATFEAVVKWKQDLDAKVQLADGSPIPCVLLANKCDQQKEGVVNNANKMNEYCEEHKFTAWFETSAKENINIEEAAKTLVKQILNNDMTNDNGRSINKDNSKFPLDGHLEDIAEKRICNC
ncbi:ras-related protein Rab-38-like isoform X1 [Rhodnius prolixus]